MRRKNKRFEYSQSMFNKYSIDESYLQTGKQRRACLELLEKIDAEQKIDDTSMIAKLVAAFQGSGVQKKVASCVTITALLAVLQSTPAMAMATADYQPQNEITSSQSIAGCSEVALDSDSFLDKASPAVKQEIKASSINLFSSPILANTYQPLENCGVLLDGDSDVAVYPHQEVKTLTVIDTALTDWETLRDAINKGEVLLLTNNENPLDAILVKLQEMGSVDCLNILSHGESGRLSFQNGVIDSQALEANKDKWAQLSDYLTKNGDIQLYGCNIAKGDAGQAFLQRLAELTQADVAASINPTGSANEGGDWVLEAAVGDVEGNLPFAKDKIAKFLGLLALPTGQQVYNLSTFADAENTLSNNYFTVSATYGTNGTESTGNIDLESSSAFLNSTNTSKFIIKIAPKNGDFTFELAEVTLATKYSYSFDIQIDGHKAETSINGFDSSFVGTFTGSTDLAATWDNFDGQELDYFTITGDAPDQYAAFSYFLFNSFTVTNMKPLNEAPVVTTSGGTTTFTENSSPVVIDSGITVADSDNTTFASATVSISSNFFDGDVLSFTNDGSMGNIDASYDAKHGEMILTSEGSSATVAQWQAALRAVKFSNTSRNLSGLTRTISFSVNDGTESSTTKTKDVSVTTINDPPVEQNNTGITVDEGTENTVIEQIMLEMNDVDNDASAVIYTLTAETANGTLKNNGTALAQNDTFTQEDINNSLITYTHGGSETIADSFKFTVSDGTAVTGEITFNITVTPVNDAPAVSESTKNGTEDTMMTFTSADFTDCYSDAENNVLSSVKITTLPTDGILKLGASAINVGDTISIANMGNINFVPNADFNGSTSFTWKGSDGTSESAATTMTLAIAAVNDAPTISSGDAASIAENTTETIYTAMGTDPDDGDTLAWSIGGTDAALFSIDSSTGALTFNEAPNFELPTDNGGNNVYNLTVTTTDKDNLTATKNILITVTNVNEAPAITSVVAVDFAEGGTGTVYTATASDEDGDNITLSMGGTDAAKFVFNSGTGILTFNATPDFETPADDGTDNVYHITITATDDGVGTLSATNNVAITVTDVNEAPTITSGTTSSVAENTTGTVYTATASDPDAGDSLAWSIGGTDAAKFDINSTTGVLSFKNAPNYEAPTDSGANNVYELTVTATDSGNLIVSQNISVTITNANEAPTITSSSAVDFSEGGTGTVYTATATDDDGNNIALSIGGTDAAKFDFDSATGILTFKSTPSFESPTDDGGDNVYNITVSATDDGVGTLNAIKGVAITVTNINDAPTITSETTANVAENTTGVIYTAMGTDPDAGDSLAWSIGGTDAAKFDINSNTGVLSFKNAPNYEAPTDSGANNVYELTVTATDSGNLTASQNVSVTVTNANEAPTITSSSAVDFSEGGTGAVYTATATDDDGNNIALSIGGTDAAKFDFDSATGILTFKSIPSFEAPTDAGGDNVYNITVSATDDGVGTLNATKDVAITVTNINDAPTITSGTTASVAENTTGVIYTAMGTDPDAGDSLTWSIGGMDAAQFNIVGATGALSFKNPLNYEAPTDNGENNVYNLTVTATDGGNLTATQDLEILVTDINEAPIISASTKNGSEDTDMTFAVTDFTKYYSDGEGNALSSVKIVALPSNGTLKLSGSAIDAGDSIPFVDLGSITFTPASNYSGNTSFTWQASDGALDSSVVTMTLAIANANDAPILAENDGKTVAEGGTDVVIAQSNLEVTDEDNLASDLTYTLTAFPANGTLKKSGSPFALNEAFTQENINNGIITYTHDGSQSTTDSFAFTVSDGAGGNIGVTTFAITITPVNDAPIVTTGSAVSIKEGTTAAFTAAATDEENNTITWSITGGADAAKFGINANTGAVSFITAPSYNAPADSDINNVYILEVSATDGTAAVSKTFTVEVTKKKSSSSDSSSAPSAPTSPTASSSTNAVVEVDGTKRDAGSVSTQTTDGKTVATITVDDSKLESILKSSAAEPIVTLPASGAPDVIIGELNGQTVKNMEQKEATLEIKTDTVTYTLPASQINIDSVSQQIGSKVQLEDIKVNIKIATTSADMVKVVENTAKKNSYQLIVKPVDFEITCTSNDKTVAVSKFNGYVERTIAIPEGIDPTKITTGIVLNADGTFRHVPTEIVVMNGKYYAKINSLTNSTYSVIWNPVTFKDVVNYWAEDAINDMGSRTVVSGDGAGNYNPNNPITRAEFSAIVVRGIGLAQGTTESSFKDVSASDWFNGYVDTASDYGLINGYDAASFGPGDTITREQAMAIITRTMKITEMDVSMADSEVEALLSNYADKDDISAYAKKSVAACLKAGIVSGTSSSTISPKKYVTRAEVAVMVQRVLQKSGLI